MISFNNNLLANRKFFHFIFCFYFLFSSSFVFPAPIFAYADSLHWDFRDRDSSSGWRISGADSIKNTIRGLSVSGDNFIQFLAPEGASIQAGEFCLLELRVKVSGVFGKMAVTWPTKGIDAGNNLEIVKLLENTGQFQTARLDLSNYHEWSGGVSQLLLGIYSEDGRMEVESIRIWRPTLARKIQFAWSEFFHPEYFRPLSINAIHGPDFLGAKWLSWNYAVIFFFAFLLASIAVFQKKGLSNFFYSKRGFKIFSLLLIFWIIFDLRFSYDMAFSLKNIMERVMAPKGKMPPFYAFGDILEFTDFCRDSLPPYSSVNYYARDDTFFPFFKYHVFPHKAGFEGTAGEYFVVFNDPRILTGGRQLIRREKEGNNILFEKGSIIARFRDNSLIYRKDSRQ